MQCLAWEVEISDDEKRGPQTKRLLRMKCFVDKFKPPLKMF